MDTLSAFLERHCTIDEFGRAKSSEVFTRYRSFAASIDERSMTVKQFPVAMARRGFTRRRMSGGVMFEGLWLKDAQ